MWGAMSRIVFVLLGLAAGVAAALYVSARGQLAAAIPAPAAREEPPQPGDSEPLDPQ